MASSLQTCTHIKDYLASMDSAAPRRGQGRRMMEDKLKLYLWWKGKVSERKAGGKGPIALLKGRQGDIPVSEALKKDEERAKRAASRRRVRGGVPASAAGGSGTRRDTAPAPVLTVPIGDIEIKQDIATL